MVRGLSAVSCNASHVRPLRSPAIVFAATAGPTQVTTAKASEKKVWKMPTPTLAGSAVVLATPPTEQIKSVIDTHTEPWGTQVTAVEIKDITLPDNMQRAMAKEAEAERERRAKIVAAEGEYQAAVKLGEAADIISQHPMALQLRTLQTMAEISVEKNSTIIFPAQFTSTVQEAIALLSKDSAPK